MAATAATSQSAVINPEAARVDVSQAVHSHLLDHRAEADGGGEGEPHLERMENTLGIMRYRRALRVPYVCVSVLKI